MLLLGSAFILWQFKRNSMWFVHSFILDIFIPPVKVHY